MTKFHLTGTYAHTDVLSGDHGLETLMWSERLFIQKIEPVLKTLTYGVNINDATASPDWFQLEQVNEEWLSSRFFPQPSLSLYPHLLEVKDFTRAGQPYREMLRLKIHFCQNDSSRYFLQGDDMTRKQEKQGQMDPLDLMIKLTLKQLEP